MSEAIRFHLDQHISPRVATALRRRGIDVTTAAEAGLSDRDDMAHIEFARAAQRVIVTKDADLLRFAASTTDHPGVVSARRDSLTLRGLIEGLILICGVLTPDEMRGQVEYL